MRSTDAHGELGRRLRMHRRGSPWSISSSAGPARDTAPPAGAAATPSPDGIDRRDCRSVDSPHGCSTSDDLEIIRGTGAPPAVDRPNTSSATMMASGRMSSCSAKTSAAGAWPLRDQLEQHAAAGTTIRGRSESREYLFREKRRRRADDGCRDEPPSAGVDATPEAQAHSEKRTSPCASTVNQSAPVYRRRQTIAWLSTILEHDPLMSRPAKGGDARD